MQWLGSADQAYRREQTQLMLIIENLGSGLPRMSTLYNDVIQTWKNALLFMDKIASGVAQSVENLQVLLGLASWHIYPDMVVLGYKEPKQIPFADKLIQPAAVITIGMKSSSDSKTGLTWTLPLSHLRFYGKPIISSSFLGLSSLRVPFQKCILIAIGSLFSDWGVYCSNLEHSLKYLICLYERLAQEEKVHQNCDPQCQARHVSYIPSRTHWIKLLGTHCKSFLNANDFDKREMTRYINLGRTRYKHFLTQSWTPGPALGLHSIPTLFSLAGLSGSVQGIEKQIEILRMIAIERPFADCTYGVIYYRYNFASPGQFASLLPDKFNNSDPEKATHRRWLLPMRIPIPGETSFNSASEETSSGSALKIDHQIMLKNAIMLMGNTAEPCGFLDSHSVCDLEGMPLDQNYLVLHRTPPDSIVWSAQRHGSSYNVPEEIVRKLVKQLVASGKIREKTRSASVTTVMAGLGLGSHKAKYEGITFRKLNCSQEVAFYFPESTKPRAIALPIDIIPGCLNKLPTSEPSIALYLQTCGDISGEANFFQSLYALDWASEIYETMPNATVDIKVASMPLIQAKWAKNEAVPERLRATAFACIAYFCSGGLVDLDERFFRNVMVLSSKSWLYVAQALLNDPYEEAQGVSCLVGNIGKPGMSLLISPEKPDLNDDFLDTWHLVNHTNFDGLYENNFGGTSMHLSMTGSEQPLITGTQGVRYTNASIIEAKVSIIHQGQWFGDFDILRIHTPSSVSKGQTWVDERLLPEVCDHNELERNDKSSFGNITSIDNWAEMLNHLPSTSVIRAKGNWHARLALASIMRMEQGNAVIAKDEVCWACVLTIANELNISPYELLILC
jgi:hypothetical protein